MLHRHLLTQAITASDADSDVVAALSELYQSLLHPRKPTERHLYAPKLEANLSSATGTSAEACLPQ